MKLVFAFLFLVGPELLAKGGGFGLSGGEFFREQYNPWFVKNTKKVTYCIDRAENHFSASEEVIDKAFHDAIAYWKNEFKGYEHGVANQDFEKIGIGSCYILGSDIKLYMGYESLPPKIIESFEKNGTQPEDYAGLAIRQKYDLKELKGKGFIYISSDSGPNVYNGGEGIPEGLWADYPILLKKLFIHELGHVFGVRHTDSGIMEAQLPEMLLKNSLLHREKPIAPFFSPANTLKYESSEFPRVVIDDARESLEIQFPSEKYILATGKISRITTSNSRFPMKIYLPKGQKVFYDRPHLYLNGPARQSIEVFSEIYFKKRNTTEKVLTSISITPDNFSATCYSKGKFKELMKCLADWTEESFLTDLKQPPQ